ncbi:MAG: DUF975 family protein [Clostridia bacterium]|nr:DUF975 family protein [Clostridia bacterium]MDD4386489.1 DUF975 family protein [Clostridia bacterium]
MNAKLKQSALNIMSGKWMNIIGIYVLYFIIIITLNHFFYLMIQQYITKNNGIIFGIQMILDFITIPLYYGLLKYYMNIKNNRQKVKTLFEFYLDVKLLFKTIQSYFIQILYIILKTLLLIIPGIIAMYEYALVEYIIIRKPEIRINDAIKQSKEMMKNHKMELVSLQLSFFGWYILIFVVMIAVATGATFILVLNGVSSELTTKILTYLMYITLIVGVVLTSSYRLLATVQLFDKIYNRFMGIEDIEDIEEDKIKKRRVSIITIFIILVVVVIIGISIYLVQTKETSNLQKFDTEMKKISECVKTNSDIDMNIYSENGLGELEQYLKNLYDDLIKRNQKYIQAYDNVGIDNLLLPSMLNADKPNMSKSKEKIKALITIYESYYKDLNAILDVNKIKNETANIKIYDTAEVKYADSIIDDVNSYSTYLYKDKVVVLNMYNSYSNLINFLGNQSKKWRGVGDQIYVDDPIIKEYNRLFNKVTEAEKNYYIN